MIINPLAHQAIRKLALIGFLLSPVAVVAPVYAAELIGKPVPVGSHPAEISSLSRSSVAQSSYNSSSYNQSSYNQGSDNQSLKQSINEPATSEPSEPTATDAPPDVPEPPEAPITESQENVHNTIQEMRESFHQDMQSDLSDSAMSPDLLIPVVAMSFLFGGPVLLVIILAFLHYRAKARRQQNINTNIDKLLAAGRDIPVELLLGEDATAVKRNASGDVTVYRGNDDNMRKGVRNIGLGAGWLIFLTIAFGIKIGSFGFIFIGLGISQVVIWKLSGPTPNSLEAKDDRVKVQE